MTLELRDELAVRIAAATDPRLPVEDVAERSYRLADALLLERWRRGVDADVPEAQGPTLQVDAVDLPYDPSWELEPRWSLHDRRALADARQRRGAGPGLASAKPDAPGERRRGTG